MYFTPQESASVLPHEFNTCPLLGWYSEGLGTDNYEVPTGVSKCPGFSHHPNTGGYNLQQYLKVMFYQAVNHGIKIITG